MDENLWQGNFTGGWQSLPPPQPPEPPQPTPEPVDRLRVATVALLNLSGLGLGYAVMRRWVAMVLCCVATGLLLLVALPPDANGVPVAILAMYVCVLGFAALHGASRDQHLRAARLGRPGLALGLSAVLLVVPASGVALYDHAQANAVQQMLLGQLSQADSLMASTPGETFDYARPTYESAFAIYRDLLVNHRDSRAGQQVPGRLDTFYQTVAASYLHAEYCVAIAPLTYLRTLPQSIGAGDLGSLATWPDSRLATALYQCGVATLSSSGQTTASTDFNLLLATFPTSSQAAEVAPAIASAISTAAALNGSDPCKSTADLTTLYTETSALTSDDAGMQTTLAKDVDTTELDIESGTFDCGVAQYKAGSFTDSQTTMNSFITAYPKDPNYAWAQKFLIAIQIAQADPDAAGVIPTLNSGGSVSITILNDSPDPVDILYTGPATGSVNIAACASCTVYSTDQDPQDTCSKSDSSYPQATIHLPPGTTYIVNQETDDSEASPNSSTEHTEDGDSYTDCAYETSGFLSSLL